MIIPDVDEDDLSFFSDLGIINMIWRWIIVCKPWGWSKRYPYLCYYKFSWSTSTHSHLLVSITTRFTLWLTMFYPKMRKENWCIHSHLNIHHHPLQSCREWWRWLYSGIKGMIADSDSDSDSDGDHHHHHRHRHQLICICFLRFSLFCRHYMQIIPYPSVTKDHHILCYMSIYFLLMKLCVFFTSLVLVSLLLPSLRRKRKRYQMKWSWMTGWLTGIIRRDDHHFLFFSSIFFWLKMKEMIQSKLMKYLHHLSCLLFKYDFSLFLSLSPIFLFRNDLFVKELIIVIIVRRETRMFE